MNSKVLYRWLCALTYAIAYTSVIANRSVLDDVFIIGSVITAKVVIYPLAILFVIAACYVMLYAAVGVLAAIIGAFSVLLPKKAPQKGDVVKERWGAELQGRLNAQIDALEIELKRANARSHGECKRANAAQLRAGELRVEVDELTQHNNKLLLALEGNKRKPKAKK